MVTNVAGTRGRRRRRAIQKNAAGNNGKMKTRDHQHVKRAGALKADAQRMRQVGAVAGNHRGQHDGVVRRSGEGRRQASHRAGSASRRALVACCSRRSRQRNDALACSSQPLHAFDARPMPST